jgi:hypothetical protein
VGRQDAATDWHIVVAQNPVALAVPEVDAAVTWLVLTITVLVLVSGVGVLCSGYYQGHQDWPPSPALRVGYVVGFPVLLGAGFVRWFWQC